MSDRNSKSGSVPSDNEQMLLSAEIWSQIDRRPNDAKLARKIQRYLTKYPGSDTHEATLRTYLARLGHPVGLTRHPPIVISALGKRTRPTQNHLGIIYADRPAVEPPAAAELLLRAFGGKRAEMIVGDALERFHRDCARGSAQRAKRIYWVDVLRGLAPLAWRKLRSTGLIALTLTAVRHWLGG